MIKYSDTPPTPIKNRFTRQRKLPISYFYIIHKYFRTD